MRQLDSALKCLRWRKKKYFFQFFYFTFFVCRAAPEWVCWLLIRSECVFMWARVKCLYCGRVHPYQYRIRRWLIYLCESCELCVPISNFAFQFKFLFVFVCIFFFLSLFFNRDDFVLDLQVSYLIYLWPLTFIPLEKSLAHHSMFSHRTFGCGRIRFLPEIIFI